MRRLGRLALACLAASLGAAALATAAAGAPAVQDPDWPGTPPESVSANAALAGARVWRPDVAGDETGNLVVAWSEQQALVASIDPAAVGSGALPPAKGPAMGAALAGTAIISGETWIHISGHYYGPQGRARVKLYRPDGVGYVLHTTTWSDVTAQFELTDLPAGAYRIIAEVWIDGFHFLGQTGDMAIHDGEVLDNQLVIMYQ